MTDVTYAADLRDSVLRASVEASTTRSAISMHSEVETVYRLPETAGDDDKRNFLALMVLYGLSTDPTRARWRNFVLTTIDSAFPAIGTKITTGQVRQYAVKTLSDHNVAQLRELCVAYEAWDEVPITDTQGQMDARDHCFGLVPTLSDLPQLVSPDLKQGFTKCRLTFEALFGYVSLVLFLAGKTIDDRNRGAITSRRPLAIENKYNLGSMPCLTGELKMSNVAHTMIHVAYTSMNHARGVIFTEVAKFSTENNDRGVETAATTTRLMAYSGMNHVVIIDQFLSATPAAVRIPILASSLVQYHASLVQLGNTSAELRPFYKLIHGDTTQAFNRKTLEPLLVVAIDAARATAPTLNNYNLPESADAIITQYKRFLRQIAEEE